MRAYPPQEPFSPIGERYHVEALRLGQRVVGEESAYGPDPYQGLLRFPAGPAASGDTLLFFHGGGWTNGYKEWMAFMAPGLNAGGVHLVSAGYRLAPGHVFPTGLEDCTAALLAVLENTRGRVFVGGHSAGGHYAALLALGPHRGRIAGCLPVSGVFEFGEGSGLPSRPRFLGADPANDAAASPARHVVAQHPPFLLAWGERDFPHLIAQAERFAGLLGDATRLVLPGCDHLGASYDTGRADGAWLPAALAWMAAQA